ncbi:hypothetical protein PsW64_02870 [Pseudovibrio sp. W64]|uniref:hypothetical protein n=1 Tax=unclassified Pseudovibrio TaxID=2627060 RepID=UPI0007AEB581|nr:MULTISPECIES: hypothetical protein [unclassified Pseudovibrio]KZK80305.1 hypothetical protein PsW64_02870 [Pseudovibrio sp. W64]KZK82534.1 hypothetical protein PsAD46_03664 [Pseudovibrio sp. Ad46]KZK98530.1 hypothetical protein PsW74_03119 [Pseudovibrio sp. W74]KZL01790.1 hypothetical protein PsAD5_00360 [Pseudovibrio sp. Ad5]KZL08376.1 hypothetical protein PsAD14_03526 [Pseudovibrio sp. Ad14]
MHQLDKYHKVVVIGLLAFGAIKLVGEIYLNIVTPIFLQGFGGFFNNSNNSLPVMLYYLGATMWGSGQLIALAFVVDYLKRLVDARTQS